MNKAFRIFLAATSWELHDQIDHLHCDMDGMWRDFVAFVGCSSFAFLDGFLGDDCPDAYFVFLLILSCFGSLHYTTLYISVLELCFSFFPVFGVWECWWQYQCKVRKEWKEKKKKKRCDVLVCEIFCACLPPVVWNFPVPIKECTYCNFAQ